MKSGDLTVLPLLAALTALAACDQPKRRDAPVETGVHSDQIAGTPTAPAWSLPMMGRPLRDVFPTTSLCIGNTDIVQKLYGGAPAGVQIIGWGWDRANKTRIERVVLVDKAYRIVGAGEGGMPRPDVPLAMPEIADPATGWFADVAVKSGPLDAYGVTRDNSICVLGHIEF